MSAFLDLAEMRAERQLPSTMQDWIGFMSSYLDLNDHPVLEGLGKVSKEKADKKALNEYTIQVGLFKKHLAILYHLPSLDELELFRYIPHETIERGVWYKKDIGFIPPEEIEIIL